MAPAKQKPSRKKAASSRPKKAVAKTRVSLKTALLIVFAALFVLFSSAFASSDIRSLFARADGIPFDLSTTMKQRRLDPGNNDRPALEKNTPTPSGVPSGAPRPTDPSGEEGNPTPTRNASAPTATPAPVPTSGEKPKCRIDGLMDPDQCTCPDTRGLKCNGEGTTVRLSDGKDHRIEYFYTPPPPGKENWGSGHLPEQYIGVKGRVFKQLSWNDYNAKKPQPNCSEWCIGKPVIYLYPEVPTYIDVEVSVPGTIFISDPLYPEGGWRDVLAYPDGTLEYQGNQYRDLYYETDINGEVRKPKNGLIIPREMLAVRLKDYTMRLGLSDFESDEFVEYWVPHLEEIDAPYFLFSILDQDEKERIDTVFIDPKPDTFIAFLAYFKPVYHLYAPVPLVLPATPPERIGYTAVEWGGTIDTAAIQE